MQNVLTLEVRDLSEYAEKVKDHYVDETFSSAQCRVAMENSLLEWYNVMLISIIFLNNFISRNKGGGAGFTVKE